LRRFSSGKTAINNAIIPQAAWFDDTGSSAIPSTTSKPLIKFNNVGLGNRRYYSFI
jgi:hypothetical protein